MTFVCDIDYGRGNLNFVHDTPSRFALSFCEVDKFLLLFFLVTAVTVIVSVKHLTFDCDLDLGSGTLNFVGDTPSHYAISFCEV